MVLNTFRKPSRRDLHAVCRFDRWALACSAGWRITKARKRKGLTSWNIKNIMQPATRFWRRCRCWAVLIALWAHCPRKINGPRPGILPTTVIPTFMCPATTWWNWWRKRRRMSHRYQTKRAYAGVLQHLPEVGIYPNDVSPNQRCHLKKSGC